MDRRLSDFATPATAILGFAVQIFVLTVFLVLVLEAEILSSAFVSNSSRDWIVNRLGGTVRTLPSGTEVTCPILPVLLISCGGSLLVNLLTWGMARRATRQGFLAAELVLRNALWTLPLLLWSCLWILGIFSLALTTLAAGSVNLVLALTLAGWLSQCIPFPSETTEINQGSHAAKGRPWGWPMVLFGVALFTVTFTGMNWGLWYNLRIPHGDSVMYEEHLWNVIHGKGFRSDLDQGLFLGEHFQVIHLFLIPVYWFWPSHLFLELSETLALALGAIPTYLIARRHTRNSAAASTLAWAYLLYFPMHYLDIAIDLKTFRPISFGVPLLLWGINALEQKQWRHMTFAFLLALACKEDYAIVIAPIGVWIACNAWWAARQSKANASWKTIVIGGATALLVTLYLLFVVKLGIPWFRNWETVHYARYFEEFGKTPTQIVLTMLTSPQLLVANLVTLGSSIYLLRLLLPLGLPIRGWSQLLVGFPLLVLLFLNSIAMQPPIGPYHHFHAPLIPILIWTTCAAAGRLSSVEQTQRRAAWIFSCALTTSIFFSFTPLSFRFWDPGHEMYWRNLYVPDKRAQQFQAVLEQLPPTARVAATDYAHSRLTHFERSYDYSEYPRAVADYENRVPDDTDYIVIDRRHRHSAGKYDDPSQLRELQNHPEEWELLPDRTAGYFTILKRRSPSSRKVK